MKICDNCLHCKVCTQHYANIHNCADFADRSEWVHLPCKVGDTVYQTDGVRIYESDICEVDILRKSIIYNTNGIAFDETAIGKSIFLTREKAEEALKEREKND